MAGHHNECTLTGDRNGKQCLADTSQLWPWTRRWSSTTVSPSDSLSVPKALLASRKLPLLSVDTVTLY